MNKMRKIALVASSVIVLAFAYACKNAEKESSLLPYQDSKLDLEARVEDLLKRMNLEEKMQQLYGHGLATDTNARLGIPAYLMSDGSVGVRTGRSTAFPASIAMASTWDTTLMNKMGIAMGEEMNAKGLNYFLAPCVNMYRIPNGGRNFECFGEDPLLTTQMSLSMIKGVHSQGVLTSIKHFVCNDQEWHRRDVNAEVDERTIREIYLPPFYAAVKEGKVGSVMASYNKLNGEYTTQNAWLLNEVLKKEWGFTGHVVSDWDATHSTIEAANNGLDLEMPQPLFYGNKLLEAVKSGKVSENTINEMVRRVLRPKFQFGLFERKIEKDTNKVSTDAIRAIALESAQKGIVLLKNNQVLPLSKEKIKTIAVIGPNAKVNRTGGGGSSMVLPKYSVSPYDALVTKLGADKVLFSIGDELNKVDANPIANEFLFTDESKTTKGLKAEYFNNINLEGKPALERVDANVNYVYHDGSPDPKINNDGFSVRWTGVLVSPVPRKYTIYTLADDGVRLWIDDKLAFENWDVHGTEKDQIEIFLDQNKPHKIKLEYFDGHMGANVMLAWDFGEAPVTTSDNLIKDAVAIAKKSDVAVLFLGRSDQTETEALDTPNNLLLPFNQNKLIQSVAAVNPNVVVVLNGAPAYDISSWKDKVSGIIDMFYLGSETGNAIAQVLLGEYNPSGKLPFTWMNKPSDYHTFKGYQDPSLKASYSEGIYLGYRYHDKNNTQPLFPFGYGLSYTTYQYSKAPKVTVLNDEVVVEQEITNTGKYAGIEIVQVYVQDNVSSIDRPIKELRAFAPVNIPAGESKIVTLKFKKQSLAYYDVSAKKWVLNPGKYTAIVAASSRDIKHQVAFEVK
jgi:beta-glucosidase